MSYVKTSGSCVHMSQHTAGNAATTVLTALAAAKLLGGTISAALISFADQPVRVTLDGRTAPTASLGLRFLAGDFLELVGEDLIRKFQMIREGGTDCDVEVAWFSR